jgi:lipopolysaccharide export system protein LptC
MTFWLDRTSQPTASGPDGKSRHDPDYMIKQLTLWRYDTTGALQHTLHAAQMHHFPDDDSTLVEQPRLTYHRTPPTTLSARTAHLNSGATAVTLIDDVVVTRGATGSTPETVLTTTRLLAYPDDETATTDEPVTITQGLSRVHGSGLRADNAAAQYVLLGRVNGIFQRRPNGVSGVGKIAETGNTLSSAAPQATARGSGKAVPKSAPKSALKSAQKSAAAKPKAKAKPQARPTPKSKTRPKSSPAPARNR